MPHGEITAGRYERPAEWNCSDWSLMIFAQELRWYNTTPATAYSWIAIASFSYQRSYV